MIDLSLLPDGGMAWLEASGPGSHLVVSTRVRLARNLDRHRFITRTDPAEREAILAEVEAAASDTDRKSTRLNSSHSQTSYAVFCLKKKKKKKKKKHQNKRGKK